MKTLGDFFWAVWFFGYFPVLAVLWLADVDATMTTAALIAWSLLVATLGGISTLVRDWFFR